MMMKLERDNIECDEDANNCVDQNTEVIPFIPLPGYRAMLKLRGGRNWITTHFQANVKFSNTSLEMVLYILKQINKLISQSSIQSNVQ